MTEIVVKIGTWFLDAYEKYLNYLLQKLPNEESLNSEALEAYLPWQKEIQKMCK